MAFLRDQRDPVAQRLKTDHDLLVVIVITLALAAAGTGVVAIAALCAVLGG